MILKHRVRLNVKPMKDETTNVIQSGQRTIRARLLTWLFGEKVGLFYLSPGKTVELVEIHEVKERADG